MSNQPLKPLEVAPITHGAVAIKIDPSAKYLVFISRAVDPESFLLDPNNPLPAGTPVYLVDDVNNAALIYEIMSAPAPEPDIPIKSPLYRATHEHKP